MPQLSGTCVLNEPSAIRVGYKWLLIPGIIWQYASVGVSDVNVGGALGVLMAIGCCES